jgi:hypothetical protein
MDLRQAAIETRNLLSEQSPALVGLPLPRIQAILPTALESYARSAFLDSRKRQQFKEKITFTFTDGEADLSDYIDGTESRISLPDIPSTTVYRESDNKPFTWVGTREQLFYGRVGSYDSPAIFIDGSTLYTRDHDTDETDTLDGDAYLTVPVYPESVEDVPTTLQKDFITFAANFVRSQMEVK